jgi:hypothetical protein
MSSENQAEIEKLEKTLKANYTKIKENIHQLYKLRQLKEYYDIMVTLELNENHITNL